MSQWRDQSPGRVLGALLVVLLAIGLAACGSDEEEARAPQGEVKASEKAFLTGMVHHHLTGIEMAEIASKRGRSAFVRRLGEEIASTHEPEIAEMRTIYERLIGGELKPDPGAHDGLGLTAAQAGMTHDEGTNKMLRAARPFDRAFVDEMVAHHRGAVKMAEVVLAKAEDSEVRKLAETIVSTQQREIEEMDAFRRKKYGARVPARGGHGGGGAPVPRGGGEEHDGGP